MQHTYKHEKPLFIIAIALGIVFWAALLYFTKGLVLIYVPFAFLIYLFTHSAFIAHLKGNAVRISETQFPDLHARFLDSCRRLDMEPPEAYVMMSDGVLNALATRFLRRKYVVLFSSIVEALKSRPEAVRFYFGHELAHIKQGHLNFGWLKFPALILPLLGAAYRRAEEYTCDMHGLAVSDSLEDGHAALGVLGSGAEKLPALNVPEFMDQRAASGGFWMSFHELTGDYPWLCKRLARISEHHGATIEPNPRRNPGAWVLAAFVPRFGIPGMGGGVGAIFVVAILGVLAAIAIPAYQDYTARAQVSMALQQLDGVRAATESFVEENRAYPDDFGQIGVPPDALESPYGRIALASDGLVLTLSSEIAALDGQTIMFSAYVADDGTINWSCAGGTLAPKYRPSRCR
jgi:Tfp pilus assembly major pilin PilA